MKKTAPRTEAKEVKSMEDRDASLRAAKSACFCISPGSENELWDVYDVAGRRTGALHRRGDPLRPGERHLCVHVWVQNAAGEYLITRRNARKSMPGLWECTGGCVTAGEESFPAALREVYEETGLKLDPAHGELVLRWEGEFFLCDVYRFRQDFDAAKLTLQPGETDEARAADAQTILALSAAGQFVPWDYLEEMLTAPADRR